MEFLTTLQNSSSIFLDSFFLKCKPSEWYINSCRPYNSSTHLNNNHDEEYHTQSNNLLLQVFLYGFITTLSVDIIFSLIFGQCILVHVACIWTVIFLAASPAHIAIWTIRPFLPVSVVFNTTTMELKIKYSIITFK